LDIGNSLEEKMIKKSFLLSLWLLTSNLLYPYQQNCFFLYEDTITHKKIVLINPFPLQNSWAIFNQTVFDTPEVLTYAHKEKLPVVMLVPRDLDGYSPLDDGFEWLEGIRVALAWASMHMRFKEHGNLTIQFVQIEDAATPTEDDLLTVLANFDGHAPCPVNNKPELPEEAVAAKFSPLSKFLQKKAHQKGSITPLFLNKKKIVPTNIQSPFVTQNSKIIVISGATGFIGTHMVEALLAQGHRIIALDNFSCSSKNNCEKLLNHPNYYLVDHDVTQPFTIAGNVDWVVHLASVPSPAFYYRLPQETLSSGLQGTKNMLDLAVQKNARFLFSSTSEVYGDPEITPQHENYPGKVNPIGKRSQYDQSKRGAETLIKFYAQQYNLDTRIARIFNTYGPYMSLEDGRVVTNFIGALLNNRPMIIYGDGKQSRSFAYVSDTVNGLIQLLQIPLDNSLAMQDRVVNIGNADEFTIQELATKINALAAQHHCKPTSVNYIPQIDATDPKMRCPDLTRAKQLLQYKAAVTLDEGLEKTLAYFKT